MKFETFSRKIHKACREWIANGGKIRSVHDSYDLMGLSDDTCNCPLGALLKESYPTSIEVKKKIGYVSDFANVFDGAFDIKADQYTRLALRCRKMYVNG